MATLIIAHLCNGRVTGRCDARCYDSKTTTCYCVCGGVNHGIGLINAARRTLAGIKFDESNLPILRVGEVHVIENAPNLQTLASTPLLDTSPLPYTSSP
ncbi:MAG: hypothetical protein MUP64_09025 [Anaerolineae bacterium]|nr:hypothetical protein [Anaerolineae bacterium]